MMEEAFRLIDDPDGEIDLSPPLDPLDRAGRARRRRLEGRRAGGRLLAARARPRCRGGDRRMGAIDARGARRLGGAQRRRPGPRPARRHLARPAPPRLDARRRRRAGQGKREPSHVEQLARARSRPAPASSPCSTPRPPRCHWLGGVLGQRSRRSASSASARPATSPTSTPPTASTAPRSPRRQPKFAPYRTENRFVNLVPSKDAACRGVIGERHRERQHISARRPFAPGPGALRRDPGGVSLEPRRRALDPPRPAAARPGADPDRRRAQLRLAEELEYARRMLDAMGDELSADMGVVDAPWRRAAGDRHRRPDARPYRRGHPLARRPDRRGRAHRHVRTEGTPHRAAPLEAIGTQRARLRLAPCQDAISTSGRSATASPMPSPAPSPRPTMCWSRR